MKNLRWARKAQKISQSKLAESIGTTTTIVSAWETGKTRMPANMLPKVAEVLNVNMEELVN